MTTTIKAKLVPWQNPYITNGLVAMWDAEWNIGNGRHDPCSTIWNDISGNGIDLAATGLVEWPCKDGIHMADGFAANDNYFFSESIPERARHMFDSGATTGECVEIACESTTIQGWQGLFSFAPSDVAETRNVFIMTRFLHDNATYNTQIFHSDRCATTFARTESAAPRIVSNHWRIRYGQSAELFANLDSLGRIDNINMEGFSLDKVAIGRSLWGNYQNWGGGIMSVRVYNRTLTPSEMAANFAVDSYRFGIHQSLTTRAGFPATTTSGGTS